MVAAQIIGLDVWLALVCVVIVLVGSGLQASIGIGLGLLAAPTLTLIDADFVPGALVLANVPLVVGMTVREHHHVDRGGIGRASAGRLVGAVVGAWVAATAGAGVIASIIGVTVLLAVAASAGGVRFTPTPNSLTVAGTAAGFTGTAAGIGGPPMAITYQHADPRVLRSSLAAFNTIGSAMTITGLVVAGVIGERELQLGLLLVPGILLGLWSGKYTIARLPPARVRTYVLVACAASALTLLIRQLV
ncbi:MAG: sulfite exporter TauE/SafE family protein [Ilumatobacter sp.]|uniref:sulfite exporter TauE/SafE family protein n=1 Tax=Ilumatobacter sp. TaxID=1967498 RepID=UPI0026026206|nr:sulfite exporter TauE/SafE family protein [Ilumatobacter sp.]MDJ0769129.1 sulfite exporter TauE/SafE family protein [Ilumatobacter sp.]